MFGFFKSEPFVDDLLGTLTRKGRHWFGSLDLPPHGMMELRLAGNRKVPEATALALAHELPNRYASFRDEIEAALFDHYTPYAEAYLLGEFTELAEPFLEVSAAKEVWS